MNDIIEKIRKHYRGENNIFEIIIDNYEGLNYYIRLDLDKKNPFCYLRSYNFNLLDKFDKKYINQETLNASFVNRINEILSMDGIPHEFNSLTLDHGIVKMNFRMDKNTYNYSFNYFIPKQLSFIQDILYTVVIDLPGRLRDLFYELSAEIDNTTERYTYNKPFKMDIFKDDIDKVFRKEVIKEGKKCYKEDQVRFVEEINGAYYAVVDDIDNKLVSVIINYDKKKKITSFICNCPNPFKCPHMYAVLQHIREDRLFRFYKVLYVETRTDQMYDKLFMGNNTYLCIGIDGTNLILLMPNGEIVAATAIDNEGKLLYKVIEDDKDGGLQKELDIIKELD